jgi:hypothetical protein
MADAARSLEPEGSILSHELKAMRYAVRKYVKSLVYRFQYYAR